MECARCLKYKTLLVFFASLITYRNLTNLLPVFKLCSSFFLISYTAFYDTKSFIKSNLIITLRPCKQHYYCYYFKNPSPFLCPLQIMLFKFVFIFILLHLTEHYSKRKLYLPKGILYSALSNIQQKYNICFKTKPNGFTANIDDIGAKFKTTASDAQTFALVKTFQKRETFNCV